VGDFSKISLATKTDNIREMKLAEACEVTVWDGYFKS
jgi:hypothetical protein